ncbi:MAG: type I pullulanase [Lachnospiraceae bacterium]|uniref:Type I pullulanase n=1 Tax=Candidatus Weimeria bifida TaxID=2599074 RepID=A0A6N7IYY0_9FIRM|nr:type I pullulanase [Candidatus Weimeria bifida]RRF97100.1 MAG: type I pullulanase [Lachnospiraceae bacterium]
MTRTPREWKDFYLSSSFSSKYDYDGQLGAFADERGTTFTVWSPCAVNVSLRFFSHGSQEEDGTDIDVPVMVYRMQPGKNGVFTLHTRKNLSGTYYDFEIEHEDKTVTTPDPYAKACGSNGMRSMVIDLRTTDPEGWEADKPPAKTDETVISEVHVKDFSWDKSGGFPDDVRGRYLAFTKNKTYLNGDDKSFRTGLSYLKNLGVTHIQLMPVFDYGSVNEADSFAFDLKGSKNGEPFNWGYDPVNYNCPEGSYSSDPYEGDVRIRELKSAIMAIHKAGFRVIMDVVYNHTYSLEDSSFQKTVPWYYYRIDKDGKPANGSGCGNDFASEMYMAHRFIKDSVLYWASEYHMDGFRFDLMGLLDTDLMNDIQASLDEIYGSGEKLVYGEPWGADNSSLEGKAHPSDKAHFKELDPEIGMFNDCIRDSVKGSVFEKHEPGFADGDKDASKLVKGILSTIGGKDFPVQNPGQSITYVSCHDNLTLWDKLSEVNWLKPTGDPEKKRLAQNRLCAAIYLMSPGRVFFLSGEEGARSKNGDENSYNASIEENAIKWDELYRHSDLIEYYKGLIGLRRSLPLLNRKDAALAEDFRVTGGSCDSLPDGLVLVQGGDESGEILMIFNGSNLSQLMALPSGKWQLCVDGDRSDYWTEDEPVLADEKIESEPMTAMIFKKITEEANFGRQEE